MCLTLTDYEIPNGPKFQDPRMSAYSPYLKESMNEVLNEVDLILEIE